MKGRWEVASNSIGGETMYCVYRLLDVDAVDHGGNREYTGKYARLKENCQVIADKLNADELKNE